MDKATPPQIGTLNESPLHASLKMYLAPEGSLFEQAVGRYVIDIIHEDLLIEIQTRHLAAMKTKLNQLLKKHPMMLVHPIAQTKWIIKGDERRRSPKKGNIWQAFDELVRIPKLLKHPNLKIRILLIELEETRRYEAGKAWRRKGWLIDEKRLLNVQEDFLFQDLASWVALLPDDLPDPFSCKDLSKIKGLNLRTAQKVAYTFYHAGAIERCGKKGRAYLYTKSE
ncbi:hypothetical protein MASR2M15_21130 [Anaerolineales bacterium]